MRSSRAPADLTELASSPPVLLWQRYGLLVLLALAILLLLFSLIRPPISTSVHTGASDALAPALGAVAGPAGAVSERIGALTSLTELRAENERLRAENQSLRDYQNAVLRLEAENKGLRSLLDLPIARAQRLLAAPVIADAGGPYSRNVIVLAGREAGVRNGLVALAAGGLAGRVVAVGASSSRVLLMNDLNARVPVLIERTRHRAMLAGNNDAELLLTEVPPGVTVQMGDRLITSGVGGIYPAGLLVGVVSRSEGSSIHVQPFADLGRLEYLQILDPGTPADLLAPESTAPLSVQVGR